MHTLFESSTSLLCPCRAPLKIIFPIPKNVIRVDDDGREG
jgi:hypothetical protein